MDGLCRRGSSGVWHHGYLEHRRSIPLGLGTSQVAKGAAGLDYGRVGRGKRKGRRKTGRRTREEDKTEVEEAEEAPGMTARNSRRFRARVLIGPTQGRSQSGVGLHQSGNMRTLREYDVVEYNAFGGKMRGCCDPGERHRMCSQLGAIPNPPERVPFPSSRGAILKRVYYCMLSSGRASGLFIGSLHISVFFYWPTYLYRIHIYRL